MGRLAHASARERYPGLASEYGPFGPVRTAGAGYGEDRSGNLDNASTTGAPLQAEAAGTIAGI